jgi:ferredoxin
MTSNQPSRRFIIDSSGCSGHGRCYALAPEYFDSDDIGFGRVLDNVAPADDREALAITISCPEDAISIVDDAAAE